MTEWERIARKLPCGRSVRVKCCKSDQSQVISHSEHGYSTYCFRCGEDSREFRSHGVRSLAELVQHRRELDEYISDRGDLTLPKDFEVMNAKHPVEAWRWLLKAGVTQTLCEHYQFGYSEDLGRVVLPVWDNQGHLAAVQSRAVFQGQQPKYMNKTGGDKSPTFESDDSLMLEGSLPGIVITEDILSAVRVGRVCRGLSTLGTHLNDKAAVRALHGHVGPVYVWYDGDEAGVKGATKAKNTLRLLGHNPIVIRTDKDPKEYDYGQIRYILGSTNP